MCYGRASPLPLPPLAPQRSVMFGCPLQSVSAECVAVRLLVLISQFNHWHWTTDRLCFYLPVYADVHVQTFERLLQLLTDNFWAAKVTSAHGD